MSDHLQTVLGILTGLGLSAACGFRVFVPMLVASIAVRAGVVEVADDFAWIGSMPALVCLSVATLFEIGGYFLPGVDHFLDVIASPAAVVAGTLLTASFITDMEPWFRWGLAAVAGGGIAAAVQTTTVVARTASGLLTFGLGNPVVAAAELFGSTTIAVLAAVAPILALLAVGMFVAWIWSLRKRRATGGVQQAPTSWGSPY
jgi:hypothetical protein